MACMAHNKHPAVLRDENLYLCAVACPDKGRVVQKDCRFSYPDSH